jgi:ELWxxDGT repeat protein
VFFQADDGTNGNELWKTDGTSEGTMLLRDINPGVSGSIPSRLTTFNGKLFFSSNDGAHGTELW